MSIIYTKHALNQMKSRSISEDIVINVLKNPDNTTIDAYGNIISQKIINDYLYRVVNNTKDKNTVIITAYKTSKIKKYEK